LRNKIVKPQASQNSVRSFYNKHDIHLTYVMINKLEASYR